MLAAWVIGLVVALPITAQSENDREEESVPAARSKSDPDVTRYAIDHIIFRPDLKRYKLFPLTNYVNTAFDTAQVSDAFSQRDYFRNHKDVFDRIFHPHRNIKKDGGYNEIAQREFAGSALLPNITLHVLGNGYDFRALAEWYDYQGIEYPYLLAFVTSYAGYVGNEAIEVSNPKVDGSDHIVDLYVFNLLGNLIFMNDSFARFAQDDLQLRNWTGQPFLDISNRKILNASNNYVVRPDLFTDDVRPFVYFGLHYFGGLSFMLADRSELSVGAGFAVENPFKSADDFGDNFKKLKPSGGLFWDKDDHLLASVIFNSTDSYLVRANIYPDLMPETDIGVDVGVFVGVSDGGTPSLGISVSKAFSIGIR